MSKLVSAIRNDKQVGQGTCSTIDECFSDVELQEALEAEGITTVKAALKWAKAYEAGRLEQEAEVRGLGGDEAEEADALYRMADELGAQQLEEELAEREPEPEPVRVRKPTSAEEGVTPYAAVEAARYEQLKSAYRRKLRCAVRAKVKAHPPKGLLPEHISELHREFAREGLQPWQVWVPAGF